MCNCVRVYSVFNLFVNLSSCYLLFLDSSMCSWSYYGVICENETTVTNTTTKTNTTPLSPRFTMGLADPFDYRREVLIPVGVCLIVCIGLFYCICPKSRRAKTKQYICNCFTTKHESLPNIIPSSITTTTDSAAQFAAAPATFSTLTLNTNRTRPLDTYSPPPYDSTVCAPRGTRTISVPVVDSASERPPSYDEACTSPPSYTDALGHTW